MFIGEYYHAIDEKGRVAVPSKFRASLKSGVIVTHGLDHCLFVFGNQEWAALAKKLISLSLAKSNSRAFSRLMLAGAMESKLDAQGRILVPDYLKRYAGLKKQVVVAGLYNRIEIWDTNIWKKYKDRKSEINFYIAEQLGELGI